MPLMQHFFGESIGIREIHEREIGIVTNGERALIRNAEPPGWRTRRVARSSLNCCQPPAILACCSAAGFGMAG